MCNYSVLVPGYLFGLFKRNDAMKFARGEIAHEELLTLQDRIRLPPFIPGYVIRHIKSRLGYKLLSPDHFLGYVLGRMSERVIPGFPQKGTLPISGVLEIVGEWSPSWVFCLQD